MFLAVSPLLKGVEAGAAKRARLAFWGDRLGGGVQARARCLNATKCDVSAVINMGFISSGGTVFNTGLQRLGVPIWTAA